MAWTAPITWTNAGIVAGTLNAQVRDNMNEIKGILDGLTASTAASSGTGMRLQIVRGVASEHVLDARVSGDTNSRFWVEADGTHQWGTGLAAPTLNLYHYGAGPYLRTDDDFMARIFRTSQADDAAAVFGSNWVSFDERANPGGGAANVVRVYAKDNGAGKTQLLAVFNTGAPVVIATQP